MEYIMNTAKSLAQQGKKQREIAEILGVTDRTVRNYLTWESAPRKQRSSLLDPYKPTIDSILNDDLHYNATVLLEKLQADGYAGPRPKERSSGLSATSAPVSFLEILISDCRLKSWMPGCLPGWEM